MDTYQKVNKGEGKYPLYMTVAHLISELQKCPQDYNVHIGRVKTITGISYDRMWKTVRISTR